jgi:endonuclease/exonuclease/phosphatase (EEP) superfamily protein YafD
MHVLISTFLNAVLLGLLLVVGGAVFGRVHPLIDLFGQFVLPAIVGAAALAILTALTGRYVTAALAAAALLANLAIAWPWISTPAQPDATGPRFKLLLFNVYYNNLHLDLAAKLIRDTSPDVVVLLEMIPRVRPAFDEVAAAYPHRLECWQGPRCDALILSRFPLTDIAANLPPARTRRSLASASVDIDGRSLTLFAAHLILPFPFTSFALQPAQADDVAASVASVSGPRLLVGDFNASTWSAAVAKQREHARLTAFTGPGGSWPTFLPTHMGIPIDHVLTSSDLVPLSRQLFTVSGSDHRAVLAEIAFKN